MTDVIYSDELICSYVDFKEKIDKQKFIFSYSGKITQAIVKTLLNMTERKIAILQEEESVKKKIFGVMINCLQTICADDKAAESTASSIFMISKDSNGFSVFVGRYMPTPMSTYLGEMIENLNALSHQSIKDLHKEKLKSLDAKDQNYNIDETTLSIIDIAKRTGQRINFEVRPGENNESFFSIQIKIN